METRIILTKIANIRAAKKGEEIHLTGHAALFDSLSDPIGGPKGFREKIRPGAFRKSLGGTTDVAAYINHNVDLILGRRSAGTLFVDEDSRGLYFDVALPDTSYARDLAVSVSRGDLRGSSFGFNTVDDEWRDEKDYELRTLNEVEVFDVSIVSDPAYPEVSDVAMRSRQYWRNSLELAQKRLRLADL